MRQKDIVKDMVNKFTIGINNALFGFVLNSGQPSIATQFIENNNRNKLIAFSNQLTAASVGPDLQVALRYAQTVFTRGRSSDTKSLVIFRTRADAGDSTVISSLEQLGVKIVVVVLGEEVDVNELSGLTGDNGNIVVLEDKEKDDKNTDDIMKSLLPGKSFLEVIFSPSETCHFY